jgi:hypothetical protein
MFVGVAYFGVAVVFATFTVLMSVSLFEAAVSAFS